MVATEPTNRMSEFCCAVLAHLKFVGRVPNDAYVQELVRLLQRLINREADVVFKRVMDNDNMLVSICALDVG